MRPDGPIYECPENCRPISANQPTIAQGSPRYLQSYHFLKIAILFTISASPLGLSPINKYVTAKLELVNLITPTVRDFPSIFLRLIDWLTVWRVATGLARVDGLTRKLTSSTSVWTCTTVHARLMRASVVIQTPTHWRSRLVKKRVRTAAGMSERRW